MVHINVTVIKTITSLFTAMILVSSDFKRGTHLERRRYVTQRPSAPRFIASKAKCLFYVLSPENENGQISELTTYCHLGQRCRMCGVCLHSPYTLRGCDEEGHHVFLIKADGAWNYSLPSGAEFKNSWSLCCLAPLTFYEQCRFNSRLGQEIYRGFIMSKLVLGPTQPPIQLGTEGSLPRRKAPRREAFYSSLFSAKVKNEWSCTSTPPDVFTMCAETPVSQPPTAFLNLMNHVFCLVEKC